MMFFLKRRIFSESLLSLAAGEAKYKPSATRKKMPDALGASGKPLSEEKLTMALTTAISS